MFVKSFNVGSTVESTVSFVIGFLLTACVVAAIASSTVGALAIFATSFVIISSLILYKDQPLLFSVYTLQLVPHISTFQTYILHSKLFSIYHTILGVLYLKPHRR